MLLLHFIILLLQCALLMFHHSAMLPLHFMKLHLHSAILMFTVYLITWCCTAHYWCSTVCKMESRRATALCGELQNCHLVIFASVTTLPPPPHLSHISPSFLLLFILIFTQWAVTPKPTLLAILILLLLLLSLLLILFAHLSFDPCTSMPSLRPSLRTHHLVLVTILNPDPSTNFNPHLDSDPDLQIPDPHLHFNQCALLIQKTECNVFYVFIPCPCYYNYLVFWAQTKLAVLMLWRIWGLVLLLGLHYSLSYCYCTNSTKLNVNNKVFVSLNTISYSASHFLANFSSLLCQILNAGCLQCRHLPIDFKICNFLDKLKFCQISVRDRFSAIL